MLGFDISEWMGREKLMEERLGMKELWVQKEEWVMVFLSVQSLNYRTGLQIVKKS